MREVHPEREEHRAGMAGRVLQEAWAPEVNQEHQDKLESAVQQDLQVDLELQEFEETEDLKERVHHLNVENKDPLDNQAHLEDQAYQDHQELLGRLGSQGLQASLEGLDLMVLQAQMAGRGAQDHQVLLVR